MWPVCVTPTHGQPHTIFRGYISISGGWMLLCKEFFMTLLCSARGHFSVALVILLVSVCSGTALTKAEESV